MEIQYLTQEWRLRQTAGEEWLPATVPGDVHSALIAAGHIPDPFVADNEKQVQWVAETGWDYQATFIPQAGLLAQEKVFLVAGGLDTLAQVVLNGKTLGNTNNMFRTYRWEVKKLLLEGQNELLVRFSSPVKYIGEKQAQRPLPGVPQAIEGAPHIRKAPCQFGWDWGPQLPPIGFYRPIYLQGFSVARLEDVHLRQFHSQGQATLDIAIVVEQWRETPLSVIVQVATPEGKTLEAQAAVNNAKAALQIQITDPQLWWPNGYGEQPLYQVAVSLQSEGQVCDRRDYQVGLRTLELRQEDDAWGKSFTFVVNGVPIFAKGSNWIPADSFPTRLSDEHLHALVRDAAATHQNMLRVWGGGFYEEERFYDLCDRYGILVWQDFIFSCSIYPLDESDFLENIRPEIVENIRRLRHRASLALWCGNNEMEAGWESWGWAKHPLEDQLPALVEQYPVLRFLLDAVGPRQLLDDWQELQQAYDRFFHHTLPAWVAELDPDTPYWPSSPSSGTPFQNSNGEQQGDAHYWDVWHGRKPFTAYRSTYPRFMSEFGFQAFPNMETVECYAPPAQRNLTSYIMEHHQRGNHGNGLIIAQMTDTFRMPVDFSGWIYLSLVLQAEGIRYGVEHWRRHMGRVAGTLYWQLNDIWPVASWASIDYFGRWKALHYAARHFYAPLLLSVEDQPPVMHLHLSSDLTEPWQGQVRWRLENLAGEPLEQGELAVTAAPLANTHLASLDFSAQVAGDQARQRVLVCELLQDGQVIRRVVSSFVPPKHLELRDPGLQALTHVHGGLLFIELHSSSLARFVEIKLSGADVVFSDNYFDLPAGRSHTLTCPLPQGWDLEQARQALEIYSLYDSFTAKTQRTRS
ncbi:MAG: glycoside hydrolase family 2 protein [Anaerolineales bacterium]|nr:glycoside hydrolase family 2 protein [Anaerolineales bacterium]